MASSSNHMDNINMSYDDSFDMNDFVNLEQGFSGSPTPSTKVEPNFSSGIDPRHMSVSSLPQQRQYNGPSHDYGQFRQQTGLPTGAISHVKAVNAYSSQVRPTAFGAAHFAGYNTGTDQDLDSSSAAYFYPNDGPMEDFVVDPSALAPDTQSAAVNKAWPGMHSEQAKAEAAAKQQDREHQMALQQPLPGNFEQTFAGDNRSRSQTSSEPQVNDQISRLLSQMRKSSNASNDDEDFKGDSSDMSHAARMRKDEEEMDEDERLLASEEGKKLSSKERRQLRNKVSARAFRSRRKEYITQLEGDLAVKSNECNDLRQTIRRQEEQINQLTQLTRAMLGHPAFGNFMEEMSNNSAYLDQFSQAPSQAPQQQQQQQPAPQNHETTHVGMTMIPENPLDFSTLNLGGNHWNAQNFQSQTTFAVFEVPQGPSLEEIRSTNLSGKQEAETIDMPASEAKIEAPSFVALPAAEAKSDCAALADYSDIKDNPSFALFLDASSPAKAAPLTLADALSRLELSIDEKPSTYFDVRVSTSADMKRVEKLLASAERTSRNIEALTAHLPQ